MTPPRFGLEQGVGLRAVRIYNEDGHHMGVSRQYNAGIFASERISEILKGRTYINTAVIEDVLPDASVEILVQVPVGETFHLFGSVAVSGDFKLEFFENPTFTDAGTISTPRNLNRLFADNAKTIHSFGPTITNDGLLIAEFFIPGGSTGNASGNIGDIQLFIGGETKNYLARYTNITGQNQTINPIGVWIEPGV